MGTPDIQLDSPVCKECWYVKPVLMGRSPIHLNYLCLSEIEFDHRLKFTIHVLLSTLDFMLNQLQKDGLENVHGEEVKVIFFAACLFHIISLFTLGPLNPG